MEVAGARFIAISVPMHTALRLGVRVAQRVRAINPNAIICCFGLYAALNADYLLDNGVDFCIGGECETPLVELVQAFELKNGDAAQTISVEGVIQRGAPVTPNLRRLSFPLPVRDALPPLQKYARLQHKGQTRVPAYTQASLGCSLLSTHPPIPPSYSRRFFIVPAAIV